jgi:CelD/BcsL family acetyltransferase involved in cellulose biosynthesis
VAGGDRDVIAIEHHAAVRPLAPEWDELADRLDAAPFSRPGWVAAWVGAFGGGRLDVIAARREGRLSGVFPVVRRAAGVRSAANAHTPSADVLAEDDGVARALVVAAYAGHPRSVTLAYLDRAGMSPSLAREAAAASGYRLAERVMVRAPYLDIEGDHEAYLRARPRFARDLGRRRRRLSELGVVAFDADGATLAELLALEAAGWKAARGTAIAARPSTRRFYADVTAWAEARGSLRLFALRLDGRPLAALLGLEEAGVLHLLKGAFDPAQASVSPGQLALGEAIANAFSVRLRRVELGGGAEPYKLAWTHTVHERVGVVAFAPGLSGRLGWAVEAHGLPLARRAGLDRVLRPGRDRMLVALDRVRTLGRPGGRLT